MLKRNISFNQIAMGITQCLRLRYLISLVLLASLLLGTASVYAQQMCSSVLLTAPTKEALFQDLNTNPVDGMDLSLWSTYVEAIQTPAQYSAFLRDIQKFAFKRVEPKNKYGAVSDARGDVALVFRLQGIDFVTPILRFRDQLDLAQKNGLLKDFEAVHRYGFDQSPEAHRRWGALQEIFRLAMFPDQLAEFIQKTSAELDYSKPEMNFALGPSARAVLSSIPTKIKEEANLVLAQELQKEFTAAKEGEGKRRRRNLEVIHYYLSAKTLLAMAQKNDGKTIPESSFTEWIDRHWAPLVTASMPKDVGNYSFKSVLDIAKIIQKQMAGQLQGTYVEVYGSLPNMKAHLQSSDVDVHFGEKLMLKYVEAFSENKDFADQRNILTKNKLVPQESLDLSQDLVKTEAALAQYLGLKDYRPSRLMTVVPISPKSFNKFYEPRKYQFYNALKVVVYEDKIAVQVYDNFEGRMYTMSLVP